MRTIISLTVSVWIFISAVHAQQKERIGPENADCSGAIFLTDTVFGPTTAPTGPGSIMEISGARTSPYAFHREHHTVWYEFIAPGTGTFTFTVVPESVKDDYDFLLFHKNEDDFCRKIRNREIKPVRTNISRNNENIHSKTGLRKDATKSFVNQGPGDDFSKALQVQKGDTMLLVLDNVYEGGKGHTLLLHFDYQREKKEQPSEKPKKQEPQHHITVTVEDKSSGEPVNAAISLGYANSSKKLVEKDNISQLTKKVEPQSEYEIVVSADKYFREIIHAETSARDTSVNLKVEMTKIEKGSKLTLKNLHFYSGSASFLRESYPTLRNLLQIMKDHPNLKIAIYGHVNQPLQWKQRNREDFLQELSERRAEAVARYLQRRGISADRMKTEGLSNREMIYPYAKTEEEQSANRRVEIVVLGI